MEKHQNKKLTFEFPSDEYVFLKMTCAKKGVTIKDFVTTAILKSIDEYEAYLDDLSLKEITEEDRKNSQPWEDVKKELGWDKLK